MEAAATAAAAELEERQQLSRAQLVQLRRKHGPQLRIISRFREAQAMAEAALEVPPHPYPHPYPRPISTLSPPHLHPISRFL